MLTPFEISALLWIVLSPVCIGALIAPWVRRNAPKPWVDLDGPELNSEPCDRFVLIDEQLKIEQEVEATNE